MSTNKHYFIEQTENGDYAIRARESRHASAVFSTQAQAIAWANELNPNDRPDVERVRDTATGGRDQWRKA